MRRLIAMLVFMAASWVALPAAAQCSLTITNMSFGTYSSAVDNSTSAATVVCSGAWYIELNPGTGAGATISNRLMTGPGGAQLSYELYQDAARSVIWGNTTSTDVTGTRNANLTVYGQIPAGQLAAPGTYSDTIDSITTSFTITATVQPACTISANALAFGTYSRTLINATSAISVTCTKSTAYNVGLSAGTGSGATVTNRKMTGPGSALLGYKLFRDSGRTLNWGNTVGTDTLTGAGSGTVQSVTIYGQLPAGEIATPGSFGDSMTATVTY
jgi:spore coat protein U-like protein